MDEGEYVQIARRSQIAEEEFYPMIGAMYEQVWLNLLPPQLVTDDLATSVAKNVVTPADAPIPECQACGACCASMLCVGVRPTENVPLENCWDITATGEDGDLTVDRYLRRDGETGACAALEGAIGETVGCRIYEQRPRMCHQFEAGSDKCHALRRAYGIEPFLTLEEMFEARQKLKAKDVESVPTETIRDAKIAEKIGTNLLEIKALLKDGTLRMIHDYDPNFETYRQFEFSGLTLLQAQTLINSRKQSKIE